MKVQSAILLSLALWACSAEPVSEGPEQQGGALSETDTPAVPADLLNFAAPEGWTEVEPTGPMRLKQFTLGDDKQNEVDVYVAYWKGGIGGLQRNLIRWKGQIGTGEGTPEPTIDTYTENGLISTLLDGEGAYTGKDGSTRTGTRLMAAYVESPSGRFDGVFTVKFTGPSAASAQWADSFRKFVQDL